MIVPIETLNRYSLIYVASPYSKYTQGPELAFRDVSALMGKLLKLGITNVYSPISHTHPIAIYGDIDPVDHSIWIPFNMAVINKCDAMVVVMMQTWEKSYGIKEEIKIFSAKGDPIFYLNPYTLSLERQPEKSGSL